MNIAEARKKIDQIDAQILALIKQRIALIPEIVEYKKKHNIAVYQEKREVEIFKQLKKLAKELGISFEMVETVWKLIISESRRVEHELLDGGKKKEKIKLKVNFSKLKIKRKKLDLKINLFEVFQSVYANFDHFYFLESLGEDTEFARKSYIGFDPVHIFSAQNKKFFILHKKPILRVERKRYFRPPPFPWPQCPPVPCPRPAPVWPPQATRSRSASE